MFIAAYKRIASINSGRHSLSTSNHKYYWTKIASSSTFCYTCYVPGVNLLASVTNSPVRKLLNKIYKLTWRIFNEHRDIWHATAGDHSISSEYKSATVASVACSSLSFPFSAIAQGHDAMVEYEKLLQPL